MTDGKNEVFLSDLQILNEATGDNSQIFIKVLCCYDRLRISILDSLTLKTFKGEVTYSEMQQTATAMDIPFERFKAECLEALTHRQKDATEFVYILGEKNFKLRKKPDSEVMHMEMQLHGAPETCAFLETACDINSALDERIEANESTVGNCCEDPKQSREYQALQEEYKMLQTYWARSKANFFKSAAHKLNLRKKRIAKLKNKLRALQENESEDSIDGPTQKM